MNFDVFFKKNLCLAKMVITFAYEVGLKSIYTKSYIRIQRPMVISTIFRISKFKREMDFF
jgi:hypothetical protein